MLGTDLCTGGPVIICQLCADELELAHQVLQLFAQRCCHACARSLV